ncbi:HEAT repeat domain-containing protein [Streptomyces sp. NPDC020742]|uniref:HEAT repeat domain-containing protein n=1 Tax=Streptomyces sp. NPDC020742 TaxID=3154897 RepID=UPI0033DDD5F0
MTELTKLIPKKPFDRGRMHRLAEQLNWIPVALDPSDDDQIFEEVWALGDYGTAVHWIEDDVFRVHYIAIEGESASQVTAEIRDNVEVHTPSSLTDLAISQRETSDVMDSLRMLAIQSSEEFNPALFAVIRWALNDPEPVVRRVALLASSIMSWKQLDPLLEYLSQHETDEVVRAEARESLKIFRDRITNSPTT